MRLVKTVLILSGLFIMLLVSFFQAPTKAGPTAPRPAETFVPARADLAEAVFAMVVENARRAGLPQPVTLCEACVAAHLGLVADVVRARCERTCGLR